MTSRTINHSVTVPRTNSRGYPIFDDIAKYDTRLSQETFKNASYTSQMRMATCDLREQLKINPQLSSRFTPEQKSAIQSGDAKIPGYTWHHHQDNSRMQLVPETIHKKTGHIGGEAMSQGQ